MTNLDNLTEEQKQQEIQDFHDKQHVMISRGKWIVIAICAFSVLGSISDVFSPHTNTVSMLVGVIVNISLVVALLNGRTWARYGFIVLFIFGAIVSMIALDAVSPSRHFSEGRSQTAGVSATLDSVTGEIFVTDALFAPPEIPREIEGVTAIQIQLWVLLVVYIASAIVLIFSKSVKEYMYAARH